MGAWLTKFLALSFRKAPVGSPNGQAGYYIKMNAASIPVPSFIAPRRRMLGFALMCVFPFFVAWSLLGVLISLVLGSDTFSQIPLIPVVSAFLIYNNKEKIFSELSSSWVLGAALIVPGTICLILARLNAWPLTTANQLSLLVLGMVLFWMGSFALLFGTKAFRAASFPLMFLVFTIPIPEPLLSKLIFFLQKGSTDATEAIYRLTNVPYFREGFEFTLPGVRIRVAEECSGIRSTLALLITTSLASHLFLRSRWKQFLLCLVVVPIAILKNGLRIFTLSTLAVYVNPAFLHGNLHKYGGIPFFVLALLPIAVFLLFLQKSENSSSAEAKIA
jgi:exosortase